ncbi:MAG: hypothetical protein KAX49_07765 [Halanaerobiales bacterium]|nr:hypothetical protein [Halanaerobiales bacterium]
MYARDLAEVLDYSKWANLIEVISKAKDVKKKMKATLKDDIFKAVEKQINECCKLLDKYKNDTGLESFEEINYKLKFIISPRINDLSLAEINAVERCLIEIKNGLTRQKYADFVRCATWLISKLDFQIKAKVQDGERRVNKKKYLVQQKVGHR